MLTLWLPLKQAAAATALLYSRKRIGSEEDDFWEPLDIEHASGDAEPDDLFHICGFHKGKAIPVTGHAGP
jgi:hypothetical protein